MKCKTIYINHTIILAAMSISLCTSCHRAQANPPRLSQIDELPISGRCDVNRVLVSPSGRIALYNNSSAVLLGPRQPKITVVGEHVHLIAPDGSAQSLMTFSESMEVVGWLKSGEILVRVARQTPYKVGSIVEPWHASIPNNARLEPSKVFDRAPFFDGLSSDSIRTLIFGGIERAARIRVYRDDGELKVTDDRSEARPAIGLSDVRMYLDHGGLPRWTFLGEDAPLEPGPYALPIIDQQSGKKIGVFGPKDLTLADKKQQQFFLSSLPADAAIVDFSAAGATSSALIENGDGSRSLLVYRDGSPSPIMPICIPAWRSRSIPSSKLEVLALPTVNQIAKAPVGVLRRLSDPRNKCLTIYFHGGPELSIREGGFSSTFRRLYKTGCDLLTVEYSGSTGGGLQLSGQIRDLGFEAFQNDAESLKVWVSKEGYTKINLLGGSFGAAPALVAKGVFGPVAKLILIVPMTSINGGGKKNVGMENIQGRSFLRALGGSASSEFDAFVSTFYGGKDAGAHFDEQLKKAYSAHGNKARIYVGSADRKAIMDDIMKMAPDAEYRIYQAGHEVVGSMQSVWDDVTRVIGGGQSGPKTQLTGNSETIAQHSK